MKKFSLVNMKRRCFTVSIDGSDTAEYALDLVANNFLAPLDSLCALYIYNSKKDSKFNYRNKKEIIVPKYEEKIKAINNELILFLTEDKTSEIHPLEQTHALAVQRNSNFLVCGYTGMKGPRGDNMELTKGIDYLLRNSKVPFILIKDKTIRKERSDGKYRWLCIFDNNQVNPHLAFDRFLPLIEVDKDEVIAITLLTFNGKKDFVEPIFNDKITENKIVNYSYEAVIIEENSSILVNKKVNFDENPFDFVILMNNKATYEKEKENSNIFSILTKSKSNLCVLNQ